MAGGHAVTLRSLKQRHHSVIMSSMPADYWIGKAVCLWTWGFPQSGRALFLRCIMPPGMAHITKLAEHL